MSSKIDPAVIQIMAENVRAEIIPRALPGLKLEPNIVQKIAQRVPVFAGMTPSALMQALASADHYPVRTGEAVFNEGDIGSAFYVVISGEVAVQTQRNGESVTLATLGTGECFGEMALVRNDVRSASVVATRDSVTMRFERERIDANAEIAQFVYRNIARILSGRLQESSIVLADLVAQQKNSGFLPI